MTIFLSDLFLPNFFRQVNPSAGGLPSVSTALLIPCPILLDLKLSKGRTITGQVCVTSRIVTVVRVDVAMLTATGADILKINRNTTAITHHHSLSLSYTMIIQCSIVIARKKNKKKFVEENFTNVNLAVSLA
jgi:hypothetical protein